ncbi:MAG: type II toxin-antitoxin system VapC family toxin [Alphaproteobacteria bacterium]|nr:type II toxin-antitoxin system VapC family toxin [Alphaproteobacteria bacterium]
MWSLTADRRLSSRVVDAMEEAHTVFVSVISLFEIGQKVRLGKWPEMAPFLDRLIDLADEQAVHFIDLTPQVSLVAAALDWEHRDPFDRILAATAITRGVVLISADQAFDNLTGMPRWSGRLW